MLNAYCRGSSDKSSDDHARPNDYQRPTADNPKKKSPKKSQKNSQKKNQKKNKNDDQADQDYSPQEPPDFVGNDPMSYEFQETNANPFPYDVDEQFYPREDVYNNDPQFQPPMTGYAHNQNY